LAKSTSCYALRCGYVSTDLEMKCPKCGKKMRTSGSIRTLGVILVVLGLILIGMMAGIILMLAPAMLQPGVRSGKTTFTGSPADAKVIFAILGSVAALGVGFSLAGLWQAITGRRNKWVAYAAVLLAVLLVGASLVADLYELFF
jgi:hypothetical protein